MFVGEQVAECVCLWGYKCIFVASTLDNPIASMAPKDIKVTYAATVQHDNILLDQELATSKV
jgi:hypothetical protein